MYETEPAALTRCSVPTNLTSPDNLRLAVEHQSDVCPLSGGESDPSPSHYRTAIASSDLSFPHPRQLPLRFACPVGKDTGLLRSAVQVRRDRCLLSAGRVWTRSTGPRCRNIETTCPPTSAFLAQACQPLWLVTSNGLYHRFTYVHHTNSLALTRIEVSRRGRHSRFVPRTPCCFGALSRQLLIHAGRFTWWNRWSPLFPRRTTRNSDFVSQRCY